MVMKQKTISKNIQKQIAAVLSIICFMLVWKGIVMFTQVGTILPGPVETIAAFARSIIDPIGRQTIIGHILWSLSRVMMGFVAGSLLGIVVGIAMGVNKTVYAIVNPLYQMIRPVPPIAWIPLTIVMLGIGFKAKIFIICFAAFVPCVMNAYTGVKLTNPTLIDVARACGASRMQIFIKVCVPSAIQMTFAGMQIALSASWSTLVAAEMLASSSGLGYMIQMGRLLARPDLIVLGMFIIGIIGFFLSGALTFLESRLSRWRVVK